MIHNTDVKEFPDLETLSEGKELIPTPQIVLDFIASRKQSLPFSLKELSKNGLVKADTMEDYLADESISSSAAKEINKSSAHYKCYIEKTFKETENKSFQFGTFAHSAFLEPKLFDDYIVEPSGALNSFDGIRPLIDFWENLYNTNEAYADLGHVLLLQKDKTKLPEIKKHLENLRMFSPLIAVDFKTKKILTEVKKNYFAYGNGILPKLLAHSLKETSFYSVDKATGLKVKVRPDALQIEKNIGVNAVISFKTTSAQTKRQFFSDAAKYAYDLSEGMYQNVISDVTGKNFNVTIMVMLQNVAPYLPALFWWDDNDIYNGKMKYENALQKIKVCTDLNQWKGFDENSESGFLKMQLPEWANFVNENVNEDPE